LPSAQAFFDIRVIALRVTTVIPIAGLILLGNRSGLLDINRRCCRYGNYRGITIVATVPAIATISPKGMITAITAQAIT
jgi:hypothetical protein